VGPGHQVPALRGGPTLPPGLSPELPEAPAGSFEETRERFCFIPLHEPRKTFNLPFRPTQKRFTTPPDYKISFSISFSRPPACVESGKPDPHRSGWNFQARASTVVPVNLQPPVFSRNHDVDLAAKPKPSRVIPTRQGFQTPPLHLPPLAWQNPRPSAATFIKGPASGCFCPSPQDPLSTLAIPSDGFPVPRAPGQFPP